MELFWKAIGVGLITAILALVLERQGKDYSLLLTLAASVMLFLTASTFLSPVTDFLGRLEALGDLNSSLLLVLLKILGIGITGEIAASVCTDAGSSSLGKGLRFLSNAAILYQSLPIFSSLLDLIQQIMISL